MKKRPGLGERKWRTAYILSLLLAFRGVVVKKCSPTGSSFEKNSDHKASIADSV